MPQLIEVRSCSAVDKGIGAKREETSFIPVLFFAWLSLKNYYYYYYRGTDACQLILKWSLQT